MFTSARNHKLTPHFAQNSQKTSDQYGQYGIRAYIRETAGEGVNQILLA